MSHHLLKLTRAQESRSAIEKLYIEMRHLFNRGYYKPQGSSGNELIEALLTLRPEIYGDIDNDEKVELDGLVYIMDRLPKGIEECRFIKLTSKEGYGSSVFEKIVPAKRRRNCYRIDDDHIYIEITRGRSEIYDIMTHLTFMYVEAEKVKKHASDDKGELTMAWKRLEQIIQEDEKRKADSEDKEIDEKHKAIAFSFLSAILGTTFEETKKAYERLNENRPKNNGLFHIVYWLGKLAIERTQKNKGRLISFTPALRERIGHHIYGEQWATRIKKKLLKHDLINRPIHIISANLHSVMNSLYAYPALFQEFKGKKSLEELAVLVSGERKDLQKEVTEFALQNGMIDLADRSGINIGVQLFDVSKLDLNRISPEIKLNKEYVQEEKPVIVVMDYAFGEQAYETMDELLKPLSWEEKEYPLNIASVSIMGKAGILYGGKGDLMIPTAHVFEGTADNYPIENACLKEEFDGNGLKVYEGPMVTVLGTSLQNRDVLSYFKDSSWNAIGLEMEGAHYQKAIQSASKIRKSVNENIKLRYAYYASDNPLVTGSTLASGSLGMTGVKPTYLITINFLNGILG